MKLLARLIDLDKVLSVVCLFLMILSILVHVLFRLMGQPIIGAQELESYLFVFMVYISIGYVTREHGHIRFDTILSSLPHRAQAIVQRLIDGACAVVFGITTYSAIVTVLRNTANKTPTLGIPFTIFILPVILGFLIMTIEYLAYAVGPSSAAKDEVA